MKANSPNSFDSHRWKFLVKEQSLDLVTLRNLCQLSIVDFYCYDVKHFELLLLTCAMQIKFDPILIL